MRRVGIFLVAIVLFAGCSSTAASNEPKVLDALCRRGPSDGRGDVTAKFPASFAGAVSQFDVRWMRLLRLCCPRWNPKIDPPLVGCPQFAKLTMRQVPPIPGPDPSSLRITLLLDLGPRASADDRRLVATLLSKSGGHQVATSAS